MSDYELIAENTESTVVAKYERVAEVCETGYQSEQELERHLIEQLQRQGYEYLSLNKADGLKENLRNQIEKLNDYTFSDNEWENFYTKEIANISQGIIEKSNTLQNDAIKTLEQDNGNVRNITLFNKKDIHANSTQVIHQYQENSGGSKNRYDVTILVNGFPMVHIELKKRGGSIREAFNQINRYGKESFWAGNGLFEYVQLFVISNGTETKYYSNTTRKRKTEETKNPKNITSCTFEFTNYWADAENHILNDLEDFTATFFSRHTLLNVLAKYCVLTTEKKLLVMRPYQIAATERLINQIEKAHNAKQWRTAEKKGKEEKSNQPNEGGGYIWHTTGSGKTLTSFKAAQIAKDLPYIDKVLFVVDRKDLDYQTMKEYDRFEEGAANGNTSTKELQKQIEKTDSKIIITTLQKLSNFIKRNPNHPFYEKEVVLIFDECHRSQFGDMHEQITQNFKKYYLFGFTGTPILKTEQSSGAGKLRTTEDVFGKRLHTYNIVNAIRDQNVLPFRIQYTNTLKAKKEIENELVWGIEEEKVLIDDERIQKVTAYILEHYHQQTSRDKQYPHVQTANVSEVVKYAYKNKNVVEKTDKVQIKGFNALFAVSGKEFAKKYYTEFKRQIAEKPEEERLKIATIFSYVTNEGEDLGEENNDNTDQMDGADREFLSNAIADYNKQFSTNYDISSENFGNYYKDVSMRMKNREIDLLIVVNMFLTGFDAPTLNTLWVDKNLRYQGLLQAFSRTNRILNSVKTFGNIVCFRNLEKATNESLQLFGDESAASTVLLRTYQEYMEGYTDAKGRAVKGYKEVIAELKEMLKPGEQPLGEKAEKAFIRQFSLVLKLNNLLRHFDDFENDNPLSERDQQNYQSIYLGLSEKYRNNEKYNKEKEEINNDVEFEIELIKQVDITIDYILDLIAQYHGSHETDKEIEIKISNAINASPELRDKKDLIDRFLQKLNSSTQPIDAEWSQHVKKEMNNELEQIITEEKLKREETFALMERAFEGNGIPEGGTEIGKTLPPMNPFDKSANREGKYNKVRDLLQTYFNKYKTIGNGNFREKAE